MKGSINRLFIEERTTANSTERDIDCNNGKNSNIKGGKRENYVIGNNLASYNSTVLYQGSNNVI
jgi:hypothetical protein